MTIDVSVIVPVANEENGLPDTIESIINQNFNGTLQIIICVNNSQDSTLRIAEKYASKYPFIKVNNLVSCSGMNEAINSGRKLAKGKYHIKCDGDVRLEFDAISKLLKSLEDENILVAGGVPVPTGKNGLFPQLMSTPLYPSSIIHGRLYGYNNERLLKHLQEKSIEGLPQEAGFNDDIWMSLIAGKEHILINPEAIVYFHPFPARDRFKMAKRNIGFYMELKKRFPEEVANYMHRIPLKEKMGYWKEYCKAEGPLKFTELMLAKKIQSGIYILAYLCNLAAQNKTWTISSESKKSF